MKILKIFFSVFLIGFLLVGFLYVKSRIQYNQDKIQWEADAVVLERNIYALKEAAKVYKEDINRWIDVASESGEEVERLMETLTIERREHAEFMSTLAELAPDEVVTQILELLRLPASEVTLTPTGVVFSLDAAYLVLTKLHAYKFSLAIEIPNMQASMQAQQEEKKALKKVIVGYVNTTGVLYQEIDQWKGLYEGEHELRLKAEAVPSLNIFNTKNVVIGIVIPVAIVGIILLLK